MGGYEMKKPINYKVLNISAWISVLLFFIVPATNQQGLRGYEYGFPVRCLSYYDVGEKTSVWLLENYTLNILGFAVNVTCIYFLIKLIVYLYKKIRLKTKKS